MALDSRDPITEGIYYYHTGRAVYLFSGYVKAKRDDLTAEQKKALKAVIKEIGDG